MPDTPTFGRYAEVPFEQLTAEQQAGYRRVIEGPRARLPAPCRIWVQNAPLMHALAPLGDHCRAGRLTLSEREREIATLVICSAWRSAFPIHAHERLGKQVGLPSAVVEAIVAGHPATLTDARERAVYDIAMALVGHRLIPQDLYDRGVAALGHEGITDMIGLMSYYTCVSMTMNFYAVPASGDAAPRH